MLSIIVLSSDGSTIYVYLDGVLIDTRELHYEALNDALGQCSKDYIISKKDHLSKFDGLSTIISIKKTSLLKLLDNPLQIKL